MPKRDYTAYQRKVIGRYYENLDAIKLGRLQELCTDLYLADSPRKLDRLWQQVEKAMAQLKVPPAIMDHIMEQRRVEILAANLTDWLKQADRGK